MTPAEQIEQRVERILQCSPEAIQEAFDTPVETGSGTYLFLKEVIAKHLMEISRNPHATKECRAHALKVAKQYLGMTQAQTEGRHEECKK